MKIKDYLEKNLEPFWQAVVWPLVCLYWWWVLKSTFLSHPDGGLGALLLGPFVLLFLFIAMGTPLLFLLAKVKQRSYRYGIVLTLLAIYLVGCGKPPIWVLVIAGAVFVAGYYGVKSSRKDAADLQSFLDKQHGE